MPLYKCGPFTWSDYPPEMLQPGQNTDVLRLTHVPPAPNPSAVAETPRRKPEYWEPPEFTQFRKDVTRDNERSITKEKAGSYGSPSPSGLNQNPTSTKSPPESSSSRNQNHTSTSEFQAKSAKKDDNYGKRQDRTQIASNTRSIDPAQRNLQSS